MFPFKLTNPIKLWLLVLSAALLACNAFMPTAQPVSKPGVATAEQPMPSGETPTSAPLPTATEQAQDNWVAADLAWSPDQAYLVVATDVGLNFHNPATRALEFSLLKGIPIYALAFSHNGKMLAAGGENAFVMDASAWKEKKITLENEIHAVIFSPQDDLLAIASAERIFLYDLQAGKIIQELAEGESHENYRALTFSPDGKYLASGSYQSETNSVRLWEVATGKLLHDFGASTFSHKDFLIFSKDGNFLNTSIITWNVTSFEKILSSTYHGEFSISPKGNYQVFMTKGNSTMPSYISFIPANKDVPYLPDIDRIDTFFVEFSPDESMLAYIDYMTGDVFLQKFNAAASAIKTFSDVDGKNFAFSPSGNLLAMARNTEQISIYNFQTQATSNLPAMNSLTNGTYAQFFSEVLIFSPDETLLAVHADNSTLEFWDLATGKIKTRFTSASNINLGNFLPDGKTASISTLTELLSPAMVFYDLENSKTLQEYQGCLEYNLPFSLSMDEDLIAAPNSNSNCKHNVTVYQTLTRQELISLNFDKENIFAYVLSADGKLLVVVSGTSIGQPARLSSWDVSSGQNLGNVNIQWPPNDHLLAISGDNAELAVYVDAQKGSSKLAMYDLPMFTSTFDQSTYCATKQPGDDLFPFQIPPLGYYSLCLGYGPRLILTAQVSSTKIEASQIDNCIILTNLETNQEVLRFVAYNKEGNNSFHQAVKISPDGKIVATGNDIIEEITLWDISSTSGSPVLPGYILQR